MKRIEELGISPWPWSVSDAQNYWINDANEKMVCDGLTFRGDCATADAEEHANSHVIAAAPDLYEALREAVSDKCVGCCRRIDDENGNCASLCMVESWRKALAKAAGEEVSNA